MATKLEHLNITVTDPHATAGWIERVFGWKIRWDGPGMETGHTVHIGEKDTYVALFAFSQPPADRDDPHVTKGGLNHWAVVVDDLQTTETLVKKEGFQPTSHADYEPGQRFYFKDHDGIEIEVVQYD